MHHEHDRKLAAIKEWFGTLDPGVAELAIEPSPYNDGFTHVDIRPKRTPDAAHIRLDVNRDNGVVFLYTSDLLLNNDDDLPDLLCLDACQAIIDGRVTDTIRLWRGKEVACTTCMHLPNEKTPICSTGIEGCLALLIGTLLRHIEKRVVHYPPY